MVSYKLLISYVEGNNLWDEAIKSESELLDITYRIIEIAAGLEKVGYYNEDLKCQNIVRRRSDGALFCIDFAGGLTDGFFPEESLHDIMAEKMDPKDGIYILGKLCGNYGHESIPRLMANFLVAFQNQLVVLYMTTA